MKKDRYNPNASCPHRPFLAGRLAQVREEGFAVHMAGVFCAMFKHRSEEIREAE